GKPIFIETTRPELLPACVALVAHPDDARYQPLFGTDAVTPLFDVRVPIVAHELADPEKGSGIAMICTFGDTTDVTWWRELDLPINWHPEFMRVRYENWVNGLIGDWNITRQRFFGVPFPIWYPIDHDGVVGHDEPILAADERLPVDPSTDVPGGYDEDQRD